MAKIYHPDILDNGLSELAGRSDLNYVVTAGVPASVAEASGVYPTGKRVSDVVVMASMSIADGASGSRQVATGNQALEVAVDVSDEDLHICIYDATRVLVVNDELTDQALTEGNPLSAPSFTIGLGQPAA